ncbi:hypothetical protein SPHINGO391_470199 [Sphingomonas aurantiaca]|uniref:Uncharacterized protein n=1 Tax=Sphingomonas aurantiaca TaxID=185949 RepID=A0A5E7ZRG0_9SPHN|nr:hypothetical protein SPHINGO391_470199 [Sphingomonas aurantiaca]
MARHVPNMPGFLLPIPFWFFITLDLVLTLRKLT